MKRDNIKPYKLHSDREKKLWETSIFIFDSSAILDFYFLPKQTREKIYKEVFSELPSRLWLPSHVEYEYLKNREKNISKPITEKYEPLKGKIKSIHQSFIKEIQKKVDEISRETINDDKHPYIEQSEIDEIRSQTEAFEKEIKIFEASILNKITTAEKEILDVANNDDVLSALEEHFEVGREYSFYEIMEITKEGKHRFEFKIPPGYGDLNQKDKKGTQIFGDLIIWKQILEFSQEKKMPIIFITNDIKKDEDWCYLDKKATEDRILCPREELIKEIKDFSNTEFWMYNLPQFLFNANKYLAAEFTEQTIQNIAQFLHTKTAKGDYLKFKCNNCDHINSYHKSELDLDFDRVGTTERSMGSEIHHVATEYFECECGNEVSAKFEVWEYPVGVHNYDSIEMDGAELLESFFFTVDFFKDEYEPELATCEECSGNKDDMGNIVDLCNEMDIENEYDVSSENSKYSSVVSGTCSWCNSLHIKCPKCGAVNGLGESESDKRKECNGGCGLIFYYDTSNDIEQMGDFNLKLIDHRIDQCSCCGRDFIDTNSTGTCDECEIEYNSE